MTCTGLLNYRRTYYQRGGGPLDQAGGVVEITGHFNDPAAERCSMAVGDPPDPQPADLALMYCQGKLVATSVILQND
jgi:hypothetical protein